MIRWKLVTVLVAVTAAIAGVAVARATAADDQVGQPRLEPFPCSELPNDPNEPGTATRSWATHGRGAGGLTCKLPLPPQAPANAQKPPCEEIFLGDDPGEPGADPVGPGAP
jgi:hypothetical protein